MSTLHLATLGGGCFWCLEAAFQRVRGVHHVQPGYCGGLASNAHYPQVCAGHTEHVEVVQLQFDPQQLPYPQLLALFFALHDPTSWDRQGNDCGSQYRSVIFHHTPEHADSARALIAQLDQSGLYPQALVTQVRPMTGFYPAEIEHHNYYQQHPLQPYCHYVITPKLEKLQAYCAEWLTTP